MPDNIYYIRASNARDDLNDCESIFTEDMMVEMCRDLAFVTEFVAGVGSMTPVELFEAKKKIKEINYLWFASLRDIVLDGIKGQNPQLYVNEKGKGSSVSERQSDGSWKTFHPEID